jgi:hypothetical protein
VKWPWQSRHAQLPEHHQASVEEADRRLAEVREQAPRVDALERWAHHEIRANSFTERMKRGLGGGA